MGFEVLGMLNDKSCRKTRGGKDSRRIAGCQARRTGIAIAEAAHGRPEVSLFGGALRWAGDG